MAWGDVAVVVFIVIFASGQVLETVLWPLGAIL